MKIRSKNSRFSYYAANLLRFSLLTARCRRKLESVLGTLGRRGDREAIADRVDYYNRISAPFELGPDAAPYRFTLLRGQRNYHMDLHEYLRYFNPALKIHFRFGDETATPARPTIVKARTLGGDNANAVLFNLNKIRHFVFVDDPLRFEDKVGKAVWRGNAVRENRRRFLERYFHHELCDVGHAHRGEENPWARERLTIADQLKHQFVLSIEGNDVASNLKWILSSNSVCLMARPRCETWFMEGRLVPNRHYVLLRDDYSDLPEKIGHYSAHPAEALEIIRHAHAHVDQFRDRGREDLVSLLVLKKYFEMSGQRP